MAVIEINWHPSDKELRGFAILWLIFFGLLGVWFFFNGAGSLVFGSLWLVAIGGGLTGLALPGALRPVYRLWMWLAFPVGWLISHLLLGLIFFGLFLPIGLVMRALGYDPMQRKLNRSATSYWSPRERKENPDRYFQQF